ncbi:MAG: M23 family metallopeptidase [Byssovorax sp.]
MRAASISLALGALAFPLAVSCVSSNPVVGTTGTTGSTSTSTGSAGQGGATSGAGGQGTGGSAGAGQGGAGGEAQGAGGAGTTTTTTGSGSSDPCAGAADGKHCGGELGGLADHSSSYTCQGGVTASTTPCPSGCAAGSCVPPPADPCASAQFGNGAYCGGTLTGGDPNALYNCQNGATAGKQDCANGCKVNPPGVADACNPAGDPCQNANSGNGAYCGASLGSGDPNTLYNCQNQATASSTMCPNGCQVNPPGVADACKPGGGGTCCVQHPPGVLTQAYSACGGGGSHYGIDYGTAIGTPIYAGIAGTVVGSALGFPNCYNNGCSADCWNAFNYVKIKSDCGDPGDGGKDFYLYYLHINDLAPGIGNGSHVDQGQLVAYSGNSGCSSGPHIHIETASVAPGTSATLNTCKSVDPSSRYCN